jgi:NAD(P)-dependent dehydrogenase (short-subunit alcohol dehydrogenase family)
VHRGCGTRPRYIRVNSVSPGPTQTQILNELGLEDAARKGLDAWMIEPIPLKKIGTAAEDAKMVAYFCGDAASFMTGAEVIMDGGTSL